MDSDDCCAVKESSKDKTENNWKEISYFNVHMQSSL